MKRLFTFTALSVIFISALLYSGSGYIGNSTIESFAKAKKILAEQIYTEHRRTFYCNCAYSESGIDLRTCGYRPLKAGARSKRIEWEHVVPAHAFGWSFAEWRDGAPSCADRKGRKYSGRKCAEKASREFRLMQADMHNLYPAIGEVNMRRSNYSMGMIPGGKKTFGDCDVIIENSKIQPGPAIRGDIARTYFYMDTAYPGRGVISGKNRQLFEAWHRSDPVDAWECGRERLIRKYQGNGNPFVSSACAAAGL